MNNYPPGVSESTPNAPWSQEPNYCTACNGEGWDEIGDRCTECNGEGYIDEDDYEEEFEYED